MPTLRRSLPFLLLLLLGALACADRPPNVVLVIGDDHAWPYSGFMGHPVVETPSLDALAAEGTVFTQGQMPAPVCRPSLQTLLSGLHPDQWEAKRRALSAAGTIDVGIFPEFYRLEVAHYRTLPRELARRGYRSWEGGKMWEGTFRDAGFTHGMAEVLIPTPNSDGQDFGREGWDPARCGASRSLDEPCPALAPLRAFLDEIGAAPFFAWFAPMLPHTPFDPPAEFTDRYQGRGLSSDEIVYYAQVTRMDAVIGELLRELEERGLRDDTLVIYVSDNGWEIGQGFFTDLGKGKSTLYELGTRTPLIFHWPGRVPAGVVRDELVAGEDLFPTILDYAGAEPLPDRHGASLRPAVERGAAAGLDHYVSFFRVAGSQRGHFVRTPRWRYLSFTFGPEELYEILTDPFQTLDLAAARADLLPGFRDDVEAWEARIAAAPPRLEIAGRLEDDDGAPIPGASLRLHATAAPLEVEVMTDERGAFRFQNLPHGDYVLEAGRRVASLDPAPVSIPIGPVGAYLPAVVGGAGEPLGRAPTSSISGRLVTLAGEALADVPVYVDEVGPEPDVAVVVRTGADGRYLAENLPPGLYTMRATPPPGRRTLRATCSVELVPRCIGDLVAKSRPPS